MGACGACSVSSRPRGDLLTPVPFRGLKSSRARGSCRSRVLRGMGACGACSASRRAPRRPSHACSLSRVEITPSQGLVSLEGSAWHGCLRCPLCFKTGPEATFSRLFPVEGGNYTEPGARVARGFCVAWVLAVPALSQSGPRGDLLTLCPFEGSAYLARNRAIKCSTVEAAISRRGRAFLGVAAARA
jgi:hypothetical protein